MRAADYDNEKLHETYKQVGRLHVRQCNGGLHDCNKGKRLNSTPLKEKAGRFLKWYDFIYMKFP